MASSSTSSPMPIIAIQPTTEAYTSDWFDNRLPSGCFPIDFAAFSDDGSAVSESPFYFEKEVQGQAQRCADELYFRNAGRTTPGLWRVQKIPTKFAVGMQVDGYGVANQVQD